MKLLPAQKSTLWILCAILVVAFLIRFAHLDRHDLTNDEALNAARAEVWFDFFGSDTQTTPVQWFEEKQWWQPLSFHDHPPFGFAFEWVSVRIFGDSVMGLRFPFVIVGVVSIYFIFLLARALFNDERAGLWAALFMALYPGAVWISRFALFDGLVMLFIIASLYFFTRAYQGNNRAWLWWGIMLGLGIITKYTILFLVPLYLILVVWRCRSVFKNKWWWSGVAASIVIMLPVIVYNIMMFKTRGHFDAALSSMVGMHPEDFALIAGRAAGGAQWQELFRVWVMLGQSFGLIMTVLGIAGIMVSIALLIKKRAVYADKIIMVYAVLLQFSALFLGTEKRFLTVWAPLFALAGGIVLYHVWCFIQKKYNKINVGLVPAFTILSIIFLLSSRGLYTNAVARGDNALYNRIDQLFAGAIPDVEAQLWEAKQVRDWQVEHEDVPAGFRRGGVAHSNTALVILDQRLDWVPRFWISTRYATHHMLPMFRIKDFVDYAKGQNVEPGIFIDYGVKDVYIIEIADAAHNAEDETKVIALGQVMTLFKNDPRFQNEEKEVIKDPYGNDFVYLHHLFF